MIHREGKAIILNIFLILTFINILWGYLSFATWVQNISLGLSSLFFLFILQFFRNPIRNTPTTSDDEQIIAPADGKVVIIQEVEETEYFKDKRIQLSIFMSPLNVHVNRYPINGQIVYTKYHPGKYLVAFHPKSSILNERCSIVVKHFQYGEILFRQIAGKVARRIVTYAKLDDTASKGQEFGFIKFGSRMDIFLPLDANISVCLSDKTKGGETVIATFKK